jgi:hypothetical protein
MKSTIFWEVTPCDIAKFINVSEERAASIFRIEEQTQKRATTVSSSPASGLKEESLTSEANLLPTAGRCLMETETLFTIIT